VQEYGLIAIGTKIFKRQISPVDSSLLFALTDCPASYFAAQTPFELQSRMLQQNKATIVTCVAHTHWSAIQIASPVINKRNGRKLYSSYSWS